MLSNFQGSFVVALPVGAVCCEIKSTTAGNEFLKIVHVEHFRTYCKRDAPIIEDDSLEEESESTAEMQDPADDLDVTD
ncbi:hypothetical protein HNY73_013326 [Argiope bruennichi]|uniref:Uncharacterized protein n=1 Tax=Argiope bruennichi TaxID=94029 RepID=A0A8T0F2C5_ARGBR|nr:hypothetical protein HNY73_013326 [Argiope bruennichi]